MCSNIDWVVIELLDNRLSTLTFLTDRRSCVPQELGSVVFLMLILSTIDELITEVYTLDVCNAIANIYEEKDV